MIRTALTMLVGDRSKFFGIVFGLAFASLLITQQAAIFCGVMSLTYGHLTDTPHADIWVADPGVIDFDANDLLNERELDNTRAVAGVRWAVPLARRILQTRIADNAIVPLMALGIDDATLIGGPLPEAMIAGAVADLRQPGSAIVDEHSAAGKLRMRVPGGGSRPLTVGDPLLINGVSIRVVGICRSTMALMLYPTVYLLRSQVMGLDRTTDPTTSSSFNFILVGLQPGADAQATCQAVGTATGLTARTRMGFSDYVYDYYLYQTGLPANFGIAVLLGFVVGAAIAGQTFSQYVSDNRRTFAALKAMGMRNERLAGILVIQGLAAAIIGFGLGVGGATLFGLGLRGTELSFRLEPLLLVITFVAVVAISLGAALISLRTVLRLDPALVFRS